MPGPCAGLSRSWRSLRKKGVDGREEPARRKSSVPRCCDHLFHQPGEAAHVAGGIEAVAEMHDDEMLRRHDHDALARVARRKERIAGNAEPDPGLRVWMFAAIGPEASGIIGIERGGGAEVDPVLVQHAFAADYTVVEVEQAEFRPVPGTG